MTRDDRLRALCCQGTPCRQPDACRCHEHQLIPIETAADVWMWADAENVRRWREWPKHSGPLSRTTVYGGDDT